jgi:hypothetical protein
MSTTFGVAFGPQIGPRSGTLLGSPVSQCLLSDPQQHDDGGGEDPCEDPTLLLCRGTCPYAALVVHINDPFTVLCCCLLLLCGLPGRNRTCDPQLRRLLFYPLNYGQLYGGPTWTRTRDQWIMSPLL